MYDSNKTKDNQEKFHKFKKIKISKDKSPATIIINNLKLNQITYHRCVLLIYIRQFEQRFCY